MAKVSKTHSSEQVLRPQHRFYGGSGAGEGAGTRKGSVENEASYLDQGKGFGKGWPPAKNEIGWRILSGPSKINLSCGQRRSRHKFLRLDVVEGDNRIKICYLEPLTTPLVRYNHCNDRKDFCNYVL